MPLLLLAIIPIALLLAVALVPLSLVQRYRVGTARRLGRSWVATLNFVTFATSASMLLVVSGVMSLWVPRALPSALVGLACGCLLGLAGLWLTRWEPGRAALYFTPNRWLVLGLTLVISARLAYGLWRAWHTWSAAADDTSWLAAAGVAGSLGAGAVVLGYYVTYWAGVRRRVLWQRRVGAGTAG